MNAVPSATTDFAASSHHEGAPGILGHIKKKRFPRLKAGIWRCFSVY